MKSPMGHHTNASKLCGQNINLRAQKSTILWAQFTKWCAQNSNLCAQFSKWCPQDRKWWAHKSNLSAQDSNLCAQDINLWAQVSNLCAQLKKYFFLHTILLFFLFPPFACPKWASVHINYSEPYIFSVLHHRTHKLTRMAVSQDFQDHMDAGELI